MGILFDVPSESWERIGRTDPYYGVLSDRKYDRNHIDAAAFGHFWKSGEVAAKALADRLKSEFGSSIRFGSALDFGCGPGRVALPLARHFETVVVVDVAQSMLDLAAANAGRAGLRNIEFVNALAPLLSAGRRFDLVHSCQVLQHMPVKGGLQAIRDMLELLSPDGILAIHFPIACTLAPARRAVKSLRQFQPFNVLVNLVRGRRWDEPLYRMNPYPLSEIVRDANARGVGTVRLRSLASPEFTAVYLFARNGERPATLP